MGALKEQKLAQMAKTSRKICSHPGVPAIKAAHIVTLAVVPVVLCCGSLQSCPGSCSEEGNLSSLHGVTWIRGWNAAAHCLRKRFATETAASGGEQEPYIRGLARF